VIGDEFFSEGLWNQFLPNFYCALWTPQIMADIADGGYFWKGFNDDIWSEELWIEHRTKEIDKAQNEWLLVVVYGIKEKTLLTSSKMRMVKP